MKKGKLMGQGRTSEVFEWETGKVIKLFKITIPNYIIDNEYKISLKIYDQLNLTPKVYDIIEVENRLGIIYERISGISMMKRISFKPWLVKKEARRLAELHHLIQQPVQFKLPTYKEVLKENISKTNLLSDDIKSNLAEYIDRLAGGNILCHGDFHPENILITKDKPIVIDWMTATKGNPAADVARTSIMFKFAVVSDKSYIKKKIISFIRNKFYTEYIKHYIKVSEISLLQVQQWELPVAAARIMERLPEPEIKALVNFVNLKMKNLK